MAFKKDPNAVLDYTVDWTAYLFPVLDAIATVTWIPEVPLVIVSQSNTANTATAFVSGGIEDTTLGLTCRITTVGGRTDDRTISLKITPR